MVAAVDVICIVFSGGGGVGVISTSIEGTCLAIESVQHTMYIKRDERIPVYSGTCVIISILLALINKRNLHLKMAMAIGPKLALSLLGSFR